MEKEKLIKQIESFQGMRLTGLLGSPVSHSMSPFLHNAAYNQLAMKNFRYITIEADEQFLPEAVEILRQYDFVGFNLTMPDKELMVSLCDKVSREAKLMQSVNTVKLERGKLVGYNTDCGGFFASLVHNGVEYKDKTMVLLGAGGAARSILAGAAFNGVGTVEVYARPSEKCDILCDFVQRLREKEYPINVHVNDIADKDNMYDAIRHADLLVNATNVGMDHPQKPAETANAEGSEGDAASEQSVQKTLIEDLSCLHPDLFVSDVIYFPRKTKLLADAEAAGCRYMNGLGMLFFQAALAFEIWHHRAMPEEILGKTV